MSETITLKSDSNLERVLAAGHFAVTGELGPPKSADPEVIRAKAGVLRGHVDAVNITDNQTAIVRMASWGASLLARECGLEPVYQITCRDRNRLAIQSDVLGACALGLSTILCLSGDHQSSGNHPTAKNVYDLDSIQLIAMLRAMRDQRKFACGEEIRNSKKDAGLAPRIYLGAAENPFGDPLAFRVVRLAKKIKAGVDFIQTQCIYDMDRFEEWMAEVRGRGLHERVKILAGVTPLKSLGMARHMRDNVPGITVPEALIQRMEQAPDPKEEGIAMCVEQIRKLRQIEGVAGVHVMAIEWEAGSVRIIEQAGLMPRP